MTFDAHVELLMERAVGVVAMAGYNTFCEILSLDKRAILVPRVQAAARAADARAARRRRSGSSACSIREESHDPPDHGGARCAGSRSSRLPSERGAEQMLDGLAVITDLVAMRVGAPGAGGAGLIAAASRGSALQRGRYAAARRSMPARPRSMSSICWASAT